VACLSNRLPHIFVVFGGFPKINKGHERLLNNVADLFVSRLFVIDVDLIPLFQLHDRVFAERRKCFRCEFVDNFTVEALIEDGHQMHFRVESPDIAFVRHVEGFAIAFENLCAFEDHRPYNLLFIRYCFAEWDFHCLHNSE